MVDCHAGVLGLNPGGPKDFPLDYFSTPSPDSFKVLSLKALYQMKMRIEIIRLIIYSRQKRLRSIFKHT